MATPSDVQERIPLFDEMRRIAADAESRGAYAGLPFDAGAYLARMVPIGLDDERNIAYSGTIDPTETIPVLMLKPEDRDTEIVYPTVSQTEVSLANALLAPYGSEVEIDFDTTGLVRHRLNLDAPMYISNRILSLALDAEHNRDRAFFLPRLITVSPLDDLSEDCAVACLGHELDH